MKRERRQPTRAELRALGASRGLTVTRYTPDGTRARLEQLTDEGRSTPPKIFARRKGGGQSS